MQVDEEILDVYYDWTGHRGKRTYWLALVLPSGLLIATQRRPTPVTTGIRFDPVPSDEGEVPGDTSNWRVERRMVPGRVTSSLAIYRGENGARTLAMLADCGVVHVALGVDDKGRPSIDEFRILPLPSLGPDLGSGAISGVAISLSEFHAFLAWPTAPASARFLALGLVDGDVKHDELLSLGKLSTFSASAYLT